MSLTWGSPWGCAPRRRFKLLRNDSMSRLCSSVIVFKWVPWGIIPNLFFSFCTTSYSAVHTQCNSSRECPRKQREFAPSPVVAERGRSGKAEVGGGRSEEGGREAPAPSEVSSWHSVRAIPSIWSDVIFCAVGYGAYALPRVYPFFSPSQTAGGVVEGRDGRPPAPIL